ncbi:membrane protein insertase YidC [Mucilaginibacter daejeonensis]|uniref:membrane protein insertase YidC n=1 Tax=Mucilaginibacter daejeonensis TaxID=398049 RepID=UPI001D178642|nr:membrane protein insertase YidC [Mucilaginibacter daejeonensis]UEG51617.1 membrane protein insertase YidC [Mucilaginibacter daejeonensis]
MDRNTLTGLVLIAAILIGSFFLMKPSEEETKKARQIEHLDSLKKAGALKKAPAVAKNDTANKVVDSAALKAPFGASTVGSEQLITLENKDVRVKLSTRGGRVYSVELKEFKTYDKKPLILFDGTNNEFGLKFTAGSTVVNTNERYFTPTGTDVKVAGTDSSSVTLRLSYSPTQYVDYVYSLAPTGYKLGYTIKLTGLDNVVANSKALNLNWSASLRKQEKDIKQERQYSTVYFKNTEDNPDYLSLTKDETKQIADQKIEWVSFKQHFFSNVLIAQQGFDKVNLAVSTDINSPDVRQMKAGLTLISNNTGTYPMEFYFGPNRFSTLQKQGHELEKQIDLGWGPLKFINRWAVIPVFNFLQNFHWNMGFVILALTVLLKLVLSPLTYKSYLSMAKMRVLKPEMDEIKAKVGEDNPTLLQQEYMKLYKKAGVNPLGGCLPLVLQMPIIFAFLRFFPSLFELRGQSFLWMHDLSTYDAFINFGFTVPFLGDHLSLMCVLMTISTLIYTYFNNQISGATGQMKYIGYISPIMFLGFLNSYPAGLNYYYFLANMFTFAQQYIIRLFVDDKKIHAQIQENKKKPEDPKKKKSGFQAKLEEMMRQQQQAQQQQGKKK